MEITLDEATVAASVNEENTLFLQAQVEHLKDRVVQLNAINRKLAALVTESEKAAEDDRLAAAEEYPTADPD